MSLEEVDVDSLLAKGPTFPGDTSDEESGKEDNTGPTFPTLTGKGDAPKLDDNDQDSDTPSSVDSEDDDDIDGSVESLDGSDSESDAGEDSSDDDTPPPPPVSSLQADESQPATSMTSDEETDDDADEEYLQKLDKGVQDNFLQNFHPESQSHNYQEVKKLALVTRDHTGQVVDPLHRTVPFLTKYERTRILGQRAKQIDAGGTAFVKVQSDILDGYLIALKELEEKKIPFIIRRPLPGGGFEYWHVKDLELLW